MSSPNKTRVQVATDPAFSNVVHDVEGAYTTALQIAEEVLPQGVNLYARGMHGHPTTGDSGWSTTVQFKILALWEAWDGSGNSIAYILDTSAYYHGGSAHMHDDIYTSVIRKSDGYLYLVVIRLTGTVIDILSTTKTQYCGSSTFNIKSLNTNKAVIAYHPSSYYASVFAFKVNTDYTITTSAVKHVVYNDKLVYDIVCDKITENRFALIFRYDSSVWSSLLWVGDVDNSLNITGVSSGSLGNGVYSPTITSLSSTVFLITFHHYNGNTYGTVCSLIGNVLTIGGNKLLNGLPNRPVTTYGVDTRQVATLSENTAIILHNVSTILKAAILTITGTNIATSALYSISTDTSKAHTESIEIEDNLILVQYTNSVIKKVMAAKLSLTEGLLSRIDEQVNDVVIDEQSVSAPAHFLIIDPNKILLTYGLDTTKSVRLKILSR